ncbi:MAG: N-6 DNA methylase, partial [Verrucomicrobia bacterium]|nr:N-6 DNA methylase [Verrucomicrobiota bacterium]
MTTPADYLQAIARSHQRGNATEHTYRPFLKAFIETRASGEVEATNEPKREKCGAPDYIVSRRRDRLTLGHIEAKDVGSDLAETEKSEQLRRYLQHLPNLLLTDYLEFRWFVQGERGWEKRGAASLGRFGPGGKVIAAEPAEQDKALGLLDAFLRQRPVDINSAQDLALRLAHLTHLIRDIIVEAFAHGEASRQLRDWREAFAKTLLPELAAQADAGHERKAASEFADMFAQTLAYGLFSARAAAPGGSFTGEQARKLIPRTNPFLRQFFEQITGAALEDEPFAGFVEDLIQTLAHAGMDQILADFGSRSRRSDPVVHFYETFLQAYDPKLRELRGVYYTPEPVVNYIVESLDALLKEKFALKDGLADRSKITLTRQEGDRTLREESHRVLILDPATGTATFLYRVLDFIREGFEKKKRAGAWGEYVHAHLLPRLFGFELLMAPYAVAHFKLGLSLAARDQPELWRQTWSYEPTKDERINVFLTNTLEDLEATAAQLGPLRMLSDEANAAFEVKQNKPVLVILGNPPYSGHSANKGEWITRLIRDYMQCDGKPLGERNPKWLHDDYVKFIRWAQWRIEQTGQGILGFITNHGYLDNPTFRGMRQSLMNTFDEIYLVDLHGNSKKKEIDPATGDADKNVFDIQQGVAIGIFVKLPPVAGGKKKKQACIVRHAHLFGSQRKAKYDWLDRHGVDNTKWTKLEPVSPKYLLIPIDQKLDGEYSRYPSIREIMPFASPGIVTARDSLTLDFDKETLWKRVMHFTTMEIERARTYYNLGADVRDWSVDNAQKDLRESGPKQTYLHRLLYRPFDQRWTYYTGVTCGFHCMPRPEGMQHFIKGENIGLLLTRQTRDDWGALVTTELAGHKSCAAYDINTVFPLYLYPNGKLPEGDLFEHENGRRPNLSAAFLTSFCACLDVKFVPDGLGNFSKREVGPELIFHYAYAIFHSPGYRARYAEFLRTDFPRLPLTGNYELFRELAGLGGQLVDLHARHQGDGSDLAFPVKGDNVIEEARYQPPQTTGPERHAGRVWINDRQYFEGIAPEVWHFPIGGYLPAERWLKDRIGRTLSFDDLNTYPRIVAALGETRRLMGEIDAAIARYGGW